MALELPFLTTDVPAIAGHLKQRPEDFVVVERPAYGPCGEGEHVLFEIEKRGLSTQNALGELARALGRPRGDFGYAGLKDARAVTRQQLSVWGSSPEAVRAVELPGLRVLAAERHQNKLRVGHLRGNHFRLRLRGVDRARAADVAAVLEVLARRGLPNAFGPQRFGRDGRSWELGRDLLAGGARGTRKRRGVTLLRFYVSAWQAWLFNRVLAARWEGFDGLLEGDLAWLHDRGAVFRVGDPQLELERARRMELSATGPLCGTQMTEPEGAARELERGVLAAAGVPDGKLGGPRFLQWKGARRPLRVPLHELEHAFGKDEHGEFLELAFGLPPGSYATCVVRELFKDAGSELDDGGDGD